MKYKLIFAILLVYLGFPVFSQQKNTDYQYALIEAVKQKNLGNIPGAIELYKMVLEANDSVAVAHYELGTLQAMMGETDLAAEHLSIACKMDRGNEWYFKSYIDILVMDENYKKAINLIIERMDEYGENAEYMFRLSNIYFQKGKHRKAIRLLEKIEAQYGVSDRITLFKANIYESRGKYEKALEEINRIMELFPESVNFKVVAAELALSNKDRELAMQYYKDVFELDSLNIYALTNLTDYYREKGAFEKSFYYMNISFLNKDISYDKKMAILSYYLGDEEIRNKYKGSLERLVQTMLEQYPDKREIHLFAADFYIQERKYEKALSAIVPVLVRSERKYELWRQGILLANAVSEYEKVIELSGKAIELFHDSIDLYYFKGLASFELGKYNDVINIFSTNTMEKTENKRQFMQMMMIVAESQYKLKNFEESDSIFRRIINIDPDNYLVMNNFSYYLALRGESLEEAEALSNRTLQKEPDNEVYLDTYAWILFRMGEYVQAEQFIMKALEQGGNADPDVNEHAGDIKMTLGKYEQAEEYFQRALILGGDQQSIEEKLNQIIQESVQ
ncbi:MAG: tetratricopeptide repeat protein [Bacteroidales bacterium]|nr:tetratricopeptide repeat protein [Bacteroidales bacterium]